MALILIVEDDSAFRSDLADQLREWGHSVLEAHDGQKGFQVIWERKPDLVLSDVDMPRQSGLDLVKRVKQSGSEFSDISFLLISSRDRSEDMMHGIGCGADDYVAKTIKSGLLKVKIDASLRKKSEILNAVKIEQFALSMGESLTNATMFASVAAVLGVVALFGLYWIKTALNINIFDDVHFHDIFW